MPKLIVHRYLANSSTVAIDEYHNITLEEIILRFSSEYWVKGNRVYQRINCSWDEEETVAMVDLEEDVEEDVLDSRIVFAPTWEGIRIEVRHYFEEIEEGKEYPLIDRLQFVDPHQAMVVLMCDHIFLKKKKWIIVSTEVDENRKVYVLYVQPDQEEGGNRHEQG